MTYPQCLLEPDRDLTEGERKVLKLWLHDLEMDGTIFGQVAGDEERKAQIRAKLGEAPQ